MKILSSLILCVFLMFGAGGTTVRQELFDIMQNASSIVIVNEGVEKTFNKNSEEFNKILQTYNKTIQNGYEMPAFGVSIHENTISSLNSGLHVKFIFLDTQKHGQMEFEELLISINKDHMGFNIIRKINGKYEGRCYYMNLNEGTTNLLYDVLFAL